MSMPPALAMAPQLTNMDLAGRIVRSSQLTFPALVGQSAAMTMGFLGPCGFNTPHTHPRSSELNLVIEGTVYTQLMTENNARVVTNKLERYQMTVFPKGALHTEFNPTCENATFVASFSDSDPGTQQAAQTLFSLSEDLVSATFGEVVDGAEVAKYASILPTPVAKGVEACLAQCGIKKR
jgi:oxalate decarboxylase/phosphoglucose isomerase-like protein (cupin superfamily)